MANELIQRFAPISGMHYCVENTGNYVRFDDHANAIAALEAKLADALHWKDLLDAKKALGARIVAEAVAAEREACAGLCDEAECDWEEMRQCTHLHKLDERSRLAGRVLAACTLGDAIRSRTPKETGADLSGAERKTD